MTKTQSWEKRFRDKWKAEGLDHAEEYCNCPPFSPDKCTCTSRYDRFKAFIQQERQRVIDEVQEVIDKNTVDGMVSPDGVLDDLTALLEDIKNYKE